MWYKEFWFKWLVGVSLAVTFVVVGVWPVYESWSQYQKEVRQEELMAYVEKNQLRKQIEKDLLALDNAALTPEGKIKSYDFGPGNLRLDATGALSITVIINDDKKLYASYIFRYRNGKVQITSMVYSSKLGEMIRGD